MKETTTCRWTLRQHPTTKHYALFYDGQIVAASDEVYLLICLATAGGD